MTPASSLWRQLCMPGVCLMQSASERSSPLHLTLSTWMGPVPAPKYAIRRAFATPLWKQTGHTHFYYIKWQDENHQKYITSVNDLNIPKRGSRLVFLKDSTVKWTVICYLVQTSMVKILNTLFYSSSTWVTLIQFMVEICTGQPERCQKHIIIMLKTPQLCSRQFVLGWAFFLFS